MVFPLVDFHSFSYLSVIFVSLRVANLAFLGQILKFWLFFNTLGFFLIGKSHTKSVFF